MKTTLKDLQNVLPIGYFTPDGKQIKNFKLRPWRMEEERMVGQIREGDNGNTMGPFVSELLSAMLTQLGHIDFAEQSPGQRRLTLSQMHMADVMYMYVWLRREALGSTLALVSTCPLCNFRAEIAADLDTLDLESVGEVDSAEELYKEIHLQKGIQIGDDLYHDVIIKPTLWQAIEGLTAKTTGNDGAMKVSLFQNSVHSIVGLEREHFVFTEDDMASMYKIDIEILNQALDDVNAGLSMTVEIKCEQCSRKYFQGLDWNYDNFFSHFSIRSHPKD